MEMQISYKAAEHFPCDTKPAAADFRADFALWMCGAQRTAFELIGSPPLSVKCSESGMVAVFPYNEWAGVITLAARVPMTRALSRLRGMGLDVVASPELGTIQVSANLKAADLQDVRVQEFMSQPRTHREAVDMAIRMLGDG